jgi:hypothetical protein
VKSTIRTYYGDTGNGIADTQQSPYITQLSRIVQREERDLPVAYRHALRHGRKPALVFDTDEWVQAEKFPATPAMVDFVNAAHRAGCTLIGLTGRNSGQQAATLGNLSAVGYEGFTDADYYTKPQGDTRSTIEYKSQTRAYLESTAGGAYDIVANLGDQYSDLIGGHADRTIKLPNPTYYLP